MYYAMPHHFLFSKHSNICNFRYFLCPIRNETFSFLVYPIKNEMFPKMEIFLSLLFHLSYFTFSSFTHKTTLHKNLCQFTNVAYLMGWREYTFSFLVRPQEYVLSDFRKSFLSNEMDSFSTNNILITFSLYLSLTLSILH